MLRAKAIKFKEQGGNLRDKSLTSTDTMLGIMSIPLVDITVNALIEWHHERLKELGTTSDAVMAAQASRK